MYQPGGLISGGSDIPVIVLLYKGEYVLTSKTFKERYEGLDRPKEDGVE